MKQTDLPSGILLVDKPEGKTSFYLIHLLRKRLHIQKIGHAGTLDPFATGVMVLLVGKKYTKIQSTFLREDKEYSCNVLLGQATDSFDKDGKVTNTSSKQPSLQEIEKALLDFQGNIEQIPPMFSAKKIRGKKLFEYARKGIEIQRKPKTVRVQTSLISYAYPYLELHVTCSSGTYVRSIAHDLGVKLGSFAHLVNLRRTRSGQFGIDQCIPVDKILDPTYDLTWKFITI